MCPRRGDAVPDFKLRNQDGRPIHIGQFNGKALVITIHLYALSVARFLPRV